MRFQSIPLLFPILFLLCIFQANALNIGAVIKGIGRIFHHPHSAPLPAPKTVPHLAPPHIAPHPAPPHPVPHPDVPRPVPDPYGRAGPDPLGKPAPHPPIPTPNPEPRPLQSPLEKPKSEPEGKPGAQNDAKKKEEEDKKNQQQQQNNQRCILNKMYFDGCNACSCNGNRRDKKKGTWTPLISCTLKMCYDAIGRPYSPRDPPKDFWVQDKNRRNNGRRPVDKPVGKPVPGK